MYAVIIEYWNGSTFSVDYNGIVVYRDKAEAERVAEIDRKSYGADAMVNVVEVEVK